MTTIVPRWEWRTFGDQFGAAEAAFDGLTPSPPHDSDELYLLSAAGGSVKVRDGKLDIKLLREVDPAGLERWEPVLKAAFPVTTAEARQVGVELGLEAFAPTQPSYELDALVEALTATGAVRAVRVHKHRVRYTVGGCMAERSDVTVDGRAVRTIAIEAEDAAAVGAAIRDVGLDGYLNTSYPAGLAAVIDDVPPRYAVIDLGTNSIKFHVAEREPGGGWRTVVDRAEITRLGEGMETSGIVGRDALERAVTAVAGMADEARSVGARAIAAVGTAGMRIAANSAEVVDEIRARTGVGVEVVSGEDEARLAFRAAVAALDLPADAAQVVFDTGGGSTQVTFGHGQRVDERWSVDVGAVRFTERFGLAGVVPEAVVKEAIGAISADLARLDDRPVPDVLVGMGGGVTNLAAVHLELASYDPERVQGSTLTRDELDRQIEIYRSLDADARRSIVGLQPKRAEVILAGACIVRTIMDKLGMERLTVSDRGLRHGVLVERFG